MARLGERATRERSSERKERRRMWKDYLDRQNNAKEKAQRRRENGKEQNETEEKTQKRKGVKHGKQRQGQWKTEIKRRK